MPAEAHGVQGHVPRPTNALDVPARAPTPGVALAGAKVPGAPSLPEWDPASFNVVLARMATELYRAPPNADQHAAPQVPSPAKMDPALPTSGAVPSTNVLPVAPHYDPVSLSLRQRVGVREPEVAPVIPSQPVAPPQAVVPPQAAIPSSPFHSAPNFESLPGFSPVLSIPLFETEVPAQGLPLSPTLSPAGEREAVVPLFSPPWQLDSSTPQLPQTRGVFDAHVIRREFPILHQQVNGRPLVWLDNAATTQKPREVIDRLTKFYEHENSNIHRAAHTLAARASDAYEQGRESVRRFLNAPSAKEIIFVRGATEGINLVAQSWGRKNVSEGDEIVITHLEHHANIVPWQQLASEKGAKLKVAPVDDSGQIILDEFEKLLSRKTRLVSLTQVSNALGTITPLQQMIAMARRHGATVMVDGAQAVSHLRVDVQALDCDFFVFSGHKVFAPTGIGAVFGKSEVLEAMPPWQGGGNMIADVTFEKTVYQGPPARFEAGTGNIADAVGLGAALDWLTRVGLENVSAYEHELLVYATERLLEVPGLRLYGTAPDKAGVLSFTLKGQKTEEMSAILDREGIAVRSGHHCAQPILRRLGVEATVRASLAPYNTYEDIDALVSALHRLQAGTSERVR